MDDNTLDQEMTIIEQKKYIEKLLHSIQDLRGTIAIMISACEEASFTDVQRQDFIGYMKFTLDGAVNPADESEDDWWQEIA